MGSNAAANHQAHARPQEQSLLPPPRPVLWPLRSIDTATVEITLLADGRRRISIQHAELRAVTPAMLAWWYGNVVGDMEYAGQILPRYLVWHPLDHISYRIVSGESGAPGTRLHVVEAFQRKPENLLDLHATIERLDAEEARIVRHVCGVALLRLSNRFRATAAGTQYTTVMTIGSDSWLGALGLNRFLRSRILPGAKANAWVRHHIEEVGNLVNFLPALYHQSTIAPTQATATDARHR